MKSVGREVSVSRALSLTSNGPLHALPFLIEESIHAEWRASVESTVAAARR